MTCMLTPIALFIVLSGCKTHELHKYILQDVSPMKHMPICRFPTKQNMTYDLYHPICIQKQFSTRKRAFCAATLNLFNTSDHEETVLLQVASHCMMTLIAKHFLLGRLHPKLESYHLRISWVKLPKSIVSLIRSLNLRSATLKTCALFLSIELLCMRTRGQIYCTTSKPCPE